MDIGGGAGQYRQIQAPELIVYTLEHEGAPGRVCVETLEFTEEGGATTVTGITRFDTQEERDGMVSAGMQDGARQSYRVLAAYLARLP